MDSKRASQIDSKESIEALGLSRYNYQWKMPRKGLFRRSQGISAYQEEISLGQELELMNLLTKHDLGSLEDLTEKNIGTIINELIANGMILKLFQILLHPKLNFKELAAMPLTIQGRVVANFFSLNPGLLILLRSLIGANESIQKKAEAGKDSQPKD